MRPAFFVRMEKPMRRCLKTFLAVAAVATTYAACASGSGGGDPSTRASFNRSIGSASRADAVERVNKVLHEYHYEVEHQGLEPNLIIETRWRQRTPFADEKELGVTTAENRITVTGRPRQTSDLGALYQLDMTIDNRVRLLGSGEWVETSATPMYRAYADSLTKAMQRELTIGVRRF
jgi:hypothetical protein